MKKYIFAYYPINKKHVGPMDEWMDWYKKNKIHVIRNVPLNSGGQELSNGGKKQIEITEKMYSLMAYDIFEVKNMTDAINLAKSCPILKHNVGSVRIYEFMDMSKK